MQNIIGLIALIAIAALLIWWGVPTWRASNSFLKWGGLVLAVVLAMAVSSVSALMIAGMVKQHVRSAPVPDLRVETTSDRIARGKAVVDGYCSACHSRTGTLTGGEESNTSFGGCQAGSELDPKGRSGDLPELAEAISSRYAESVYVRYGSLADVRRTGAIVS